MQSNYNGQTPHLRLGDKVIVYIYGVGVISETVQNIRQKGCTWEYNYDIPEAFTYSDVQFIEKKGEWKKT